MKNTMKNTKKNTKNRAGRYVTIPVLAGMMALTMPAMAGEVLIKPAKIVTNAAPVKSGNVLLIDADGRLHFVEASKAPQSAEIIAEADKGKTLWVTPGLFGAYASLGLLEVSGESSTNFTDAADDKANVHIRAADSYNPHSTAVPVTRLGGVLFAAIAPGAGEVPFGGIGALVDTSGSLEASVREADSFVFYNLSGHYGGEWQGRAKNFTVLRDALMDAKDYASRFSAPDGGDALRRADARALRSVVSGKKPLLVYVDRAVDIKNLLDIRKDWPSLRLIIVGGAEGWMLADRLAKETEGVIIDPIESLPQNFDRIATRTDNAIRLHKAGVKLAFMNRSGVGGSAHNLRLIGQTAGNAVAEGLDWDTAFKAVSLNPASLYGHGEWGQLQEGAKANLVVWDGDPLEVTSAPIAIFIDGKRQSLESRQTKLRDRYNPVKKSDKPYGYEP